MATPKRTYKYLIQYRDDNYRVVELTKDEFLNVCDCLRNREYAVDIKDGILVLGDVRAIVKVADEPTTEAKTSPYAHFDHATIEWLRQMGIDTEKGGINE